MALALEDMGWGTADDWMRIQAAYEPALAPGPWRRRRARACRARMIVSRGHTVRRSLHTDKHAVVVRQAKPN